MAERRGYFSRTWQSMKATRNWFGKICLLGLVSFVPVLGSIVVMGYLYGWGRDAAWRMDNPLPDHVFGNEDGRLYRRGFFAVVISVGLPLIVGVGSVVLLSAFGFAASGALSVLSRLVPDAAFPVLTLPSLLGSFALFLGFVALVFFTQFFVWVGSMRMSIYGTISSGFQVSQVWSMVRRNPAGLFKIALGQTAAWAALGVVMTVAWSVVAFVIAFVALLAAGAVDYSASYGSAFGGIATIGTIATVLLAVFVVYVSLTASVVIQAFVCRSLGYWTEEFEVATWGSQNDPIPYPPARGGVPYDARG